MKCDICKQREATTHVTKIVNGHSREYHFCAECAAKSPEYKELKSNMNFGIGDFLTGMFTGGKQAIEPDSNICPTCKMAYSEFLKTGKLGCGDCYLTFRTKLSRPVKQIHGTIEHIGKTPLRSGEKLIIDKKISALEKQMTEAVSTQDFEKAAILRDEIKALKEQKEA